MSTNSQEPAAATPSIIAVKSATDIEVGVRFRHAMKVELAMSVDGLRPDWAERETSYFTGRTAEGGAQWYLARADQNFIGSSCAFVDDTWFSKMLVRPRTGWIIGVYVLPAFRRRGIARALTIAALEWLRAAGCAEAKLHASAYGRAIYDSMGFAITNEMKLTL